jgi:hypothetical protein
MSGELISFSVKNLDVNFARLWLGGVGIASLFAFTAEGLRSFGLFFCVIMFVGGLFYFKQTVWGLADEIWDNDSFLLVVKSGHQHRLYFNEIESIKHTYPNHKHLITIKTKHKSNIGRSVTFRAAKGYPTFTSPKVLNSLQARVYNA